MRWLIGLVALGLVVLGCDGEGAIWSTYSAAPVSPIGVSDFVTQREILAGQVLTPQAEEIDHVLIGVAPDWGCTLPEQIRLGLWDELPTEKPWSKMAFYPVGPPISTGDDFAFLPVDLGQSVPLPHWISFGIEHAECGVKSTIAKGAAGTRWTNTNGWIGIDGQVVIGAAGD